MATTLETLNHELQQAESDLAATREKLDIEELRTPPERDLQWRLEEGVRKLGALVTKIKASIESETARLASDEEVARRSALRARRDRAVKLAREALPAGWKTLHDLVTEATEVARALNETASIAVADVTAAIRAHHGGDQHAAVNETKQVVDLLLGNDHHARSFATLLVQLINALPAGASRRLREQYIDVNEYSFAGLAPTTVQAACEAASERLEQRVAYILNDVATTPKPGHSAVPGAGPAKTKVEA